MLDEIREGVHHVPQAAHLGLVGVREELLVGLEVGVENVLANLLHHLFVGLTGFGRYKVVVLIRAQALPELVGHEIALHALFINEVARHFLATLVA